MNIYQELITNYEIIFDSFSDRIIELGSISVPDTTFTIDDTLILDIARMEELEYKPFYQIFDIMLELGIQKTMIQAFEESYNSSGIKIKLSAVANIHIDDFVCYRTKHMIEENNLKKKEFIILKEKDDTKFGPCMLSNSGIAAFKVWDSNNNKLILMDHRNLARILDIELEENYRDWDEHSLSILKLALPNS